jgi:hypothetical protein
MPYQDVMNAILPQRSQALADHQQQLHAQQQQSAWASPGAGP